MSAATAMYLMSSLQQNCGETVIRKYKTKDNHNTEANNAHHQLTILFFCFEQSFELTVAIWNEQYQIDLVSFIS